jgi:hypothetical protein
MFRPERTPTNSRRKVTLLGGTIAALLLVSLLGSSASTAARTQAPRNTSLPTVSGTPRQGQALTGTTGVWSGTSPVSFAFQWLRCNPANANLCAAVASATSATYVLRDDDVGRRMRFRVTASNADGSASALSAATSVIVASSAPLNTAEPTISGTPRFRATLTASTGSWTGATPITYAYQWLRCDASGGRPDGSNCAIVAGATNAFGSATATSNATAVVPPEGTRPVNTRPPTATGSYVQGQVLRASPGTWTGAAPITFAFRWLRCNANGSGCATIVAATDNSYFIRNTDVGSTLRVQVTARNSLGSATAVSGPTRVIVAPGPPPPPPPGGVITLPNGERSIPVTSVPANHRLVVDRVLFTPNPVRSRNTIISMRIKIKDTRGYVVRDALVFARSTPLVTVVPAISRTGQDGWIRYDVRPEADFPIRRGYSVQFFVKAYRQGDPPLAGVAGYRLVQVRTAP